MSESSEPSWYYNAVVDEHDAAMAWGCSIDEWDAKSPEDRGRMIETYRGQRIRQAWERFVILK